MTISILLVAGFGIYNVLNMMVSQKHKEIAILRSIGFEAKDVLFLFFLQGMTIGILGGLLGDFLGFFVCKYMSTLEPGRQKQWALRALCLFPFCHRSISKDFSWPLARPPWRVYCLRVSAANQTHRNHSIGGLLKCLS